MSVRPTGDAAYTDGRGQLVVEPRIVRGAEIAGDRHLRVDACVIGSGAGGAPAAAELAQAGMSVAILEEGDWHATDELTARPRDMSALLYRDAGQTVTVGNVPIVLPLGRAVGGTTLINSGTCFRTPDAVLGHWREHFGLGAMSREELEPYFRRVERIINVSQVPARLAGDNALIVQRGAQALGWSGDFLYRNARGCVGSGVCAFGCPTAAKQYMGITYAPLAWQAGATTYIGARARELDLAAGASGRRRARAVVASTSGGGRLIVECEHVIVACGAIHTPLFLAEKGLGATSGELGHNLSIHPATGVRALMQERVDMFRGVPQSYYIDEFAGEGLMLEGAVGPPDQLAMTLPRIGDAHRELMAQYREMSQFGVMVSDTSRGAVRKVLGRPQIRYDLNAHDTALFKRGIELLAELYWAAGATKVLVPVRGVPVLEHPGDTALRDRDVRARDLTLMAFHPLGSARAGEDPTSSVVDGDLRVHDAENVHVADGSAVPSSLGVNPQITIMALATRLAHHLAGIPAPTGEPEPEHLPEPRVAAHV